MLLLLLSRMTICASMGPSSKSPSTESVRCLIRGILRPTWFRVKIKGSNLKHWRFLKSCYRSKAENENRCHLFQVSRGTPKLEKAMTFFLATLNICSCDFRLPKNSECRINSRLFLFLASVKIQTQSQGQPVQGGYTFIYRRTLVLLKFSILI